MNLEKFNLYLKEVQSLAAAMDKNSDSLKDLLELIDNYRIEFIEEPFLDSVFLGETAFYKKKYGLALKHYLKAPKAPFFHFFSYRATAFLHFQLGDKAKAKSFAEKALQIFPEDYSVSALLKQILAAETQPEQLPDIQSDPQSSPLPNQEQTSAAPAPAHEIDPGKNNDYKTDKEYLFKVHTVHEHLLEGLDYTRIDKLQNDPTTLKLYLLEEIEKKILDLKLVPTKEESQRMAISVYDEVMGFGPIEPLFQGRNHHRHFYQWTGFNLY